MGNNEKELSLEELDKVTGGASVEVSQIVEVFADHDANSSVIAKIRKGETIAVKDTFYRDRSSGQDWYQSTSPYPGWVKGSDIGR